MYLKIIDSKWISIFGVHQLNHCYVLYGIALKVPRRINAIPKSVIYFLVETILFKYSVKYSSIKGTFFETEVWNYACWIMHNSNNLTVRVLFFNVKYDVKREWDNRHKLVLQSHNMPSKYLPSVIVRCFFSY